VVEVVVEEAATRQTTFCHPVGGAMLPLAPLLLLMLLNLVPFSG